MIQNQGMYYKATHMKGGGWLALLDKDSESVDSVKKAIDAANKKAINAGWHAERYVITRVVWENIFDDEHNFLHSSKSETALEHYPETI